MLTSWAWYCSSRRAPEEDVTEGGAVRKEDGEGGSQVPSTQVGGEVEKRSGEVIRW